MNSLSYLLSKRLPVRGDYADDETQAVAEYSFYMQMLTANLHINNAF